jgi:hypothetical protein
MDPLRPPHAVVTHCAVDRRVHGAPLSYEFRGDAFRAPAIAAYCDQGLCE